MTIKELQPTDLWNYFYEITQIPRPSKKEGKILAYLLDFAQKHNLEAKQDKAGNVLITKPATPGKEGTPTVVLQSHVDMVCEKNNDVTHNFETDPIETIIDGDWVKANGTTLGADNGVGVAAALAILASDNIPHGKIEALFTVDEETGLTGANALEKNFITGEILINLDTEEEGQIYIGCAGGRGTKAYFKYKSKDVPKKYFWFRVDVKGLRGGHSGSDIDRGFANANKILNRFLYSLSRKKYGMVLSEISGGNLHNAIPREAHAIIGVKRQIQGRYTHKAQYIPGKSSGRIQSSGSGTQHHPRDRRNSVKNYQQTHHREPDSFTLRMPSRGDRYESRYSRIGGNIDQFGFGKNDRRKYY